MCSCVTLLGPMYIVYRHLLLFMTCMCSNCWWSGVDNNDGETVVLVLAASSCTNGLSSSCAKRRIYSATIQYLLKIVGLLEKNHFVDLKKMDEIKAHTSIFYFSNTIPNTNTNTKVHLKRRRSKPALWLQDCCPSKSLRRMGRCYSFSYMSKTTPFK